jgi:hypothetical protein
MGLLVAIFVTVPMPLNELGALNDGGADDPVGLPKMVPAAALSAVKENAGVVVGFVTVTLNSGEKLPELTLVTVPPPPLSTNHVHGGNPVSKHT